MLCFEPLRPEAAAFLRGPGSQRRGCTISGNDPKDLVLPPEKRWLLCVAVALVLLCIGCIQLIIDISRGEIQKTRLAFRFEGGVAALLIGALAEMSPL